MGIFPFIFFGLGPKAFKTYRSWLQNLFSLLKLPNLLNFLQTHALRIVGWFNQRVVPVNPEHFIPFEAIDITLDPHPLDDLPKVSRSSPTQPRPAFHPASLRGTQQHALPARSPSGEWRTYHKQTITTELRPIHHSPDLPLSRPSSKDKQVIRATSRCKCSDKEFIPSRLVPQTSIVAPDRPASMSVSSTITRLDSRRTPDDALSTLF
ncbi:hypothetical protein FRC19_005363 [Serendipita sp. 401]|nr:hypothetical protein FRC15_012087 [Serendipita sp. 397]KAG8791244.1 hypothetical protein FRC16_000489 [Serendipita sp. 398]KAG8809224.1 hypothetical protein FRC19_005363 [Serendipita sp. 401]KAG8866627.1 hypothetical protein FRC20_007955 [Serendipita sp. 405]